MRYPIKSILVLFGLALCLGITSCSAFRKKNRCNTCPTWHDEVKGIEDDEL